MESLGAKVWAIAEGYIPSGSTGPEPEMESHGTLCILNTGNTVAQLRVRVFFADREPVGPYRVEVAARRTLHQRLNNLTDPERIPRDTDFSVVVEADRPVVIQHTRLDSRPPAHALMTTMAYAAQ